MAIARLQVHGPRPTGSGESVDDAVELYQRTYSTLLRSSGETRLRVLEPSHRAMGSSLHPLPAGGPPPPLPGPAPPCKGLEPAPARRQRRARPRRLPLRDPPPAGRDRAGAADRHGPGPGAVPPLRRRPARGVGAGRGARAPATL